jgi:hypothetical protein
MEARKSTSVSTYRLKTGFDQHVTTGSEGYKDFD